MLRTVTSTDLSTSRESSALFEVRSVRTWTIEASCDVLYHYCLRPHRTEQWWWGSVAFIYGWPDSSCCPASDKPHTFIPELNYVYKQALPVAAKLVALAQIQVSVSVLCQPFEMPGIAQKTATLHPLSLPCCFPIKWKNKSTARLLP